jgi:hypothetical protein
MRNIIRSSLLWQAIAFWSVFWLVVPFVSKNRLYEAVTAMAAAIGVGVLIAYMPGIIHVIRSSDRRSGNLLILGIGCTWLAILGNRVWGWTFQYLGTPEWMLHHQALSFIIWIAFSGGVLHLTAYNAVDGKVPSWAWAMIGGIAAAGLFLSYGIAWLAGST